jgi:hypothetical protein
MNHSQDARPGAIGSTRWLKRALVVWAVWSSLALFFASKYYLERHVHGFGVTWTKALWWHFMEWYGWAACSPIIFYACRKAVTGRAHWLPAALIHLGAGTATSLIQVTIFSTGAYIESLLLDTGFSWLYLFKAIIVHHFHFNLFVYAAIAAFWYAREYYRKASERELKTKELELQLSQAQLHALKMQLQPHFLFNTLNGIAALNYDDPKTANRMLAKLGDLLRLALETDAEISLQDEWDFNARYLDLEQIRLADRLKVHTNMAPETLAATVPSFLLQPLFENAIRHAIAPFPGGGELTLTSRRDGDHLQLQVIDTGPGISRSELHQEGVGLTNTRARLRNLFGPDHAFSLSNGPAGGLIVDISIPFRLRSVNGSAERSSLGEKACNDAIPPRTQVEFENSHAHH